MIKPTMQDLSRDEYNRYEIALATAKCARMITNEYVRQRTEAERSMTGNKETDRPLNTMIDREVRDEKAVKIAINRIHDGKYAITHKSVEEQEKDEASILEGLNGPAPASADALAMEQMGDDAGEDLSDEEYSDEEFSDEELSDEEFSDEEIPEDEADPAGDAD